MSARSRCEPSAARRFWIGGRDDPDLGRRLPCLGLDRAIRRDSDLPVVRTDMDRAAAVVEQRVARRIADGAVRLDGEAPGAGQPDAVARLDLEIAGAAEGEIERVARVGQRAGRRVTPGCAILREGERGLATLRRTAPACAAASR